MDEAMLKRRELLSARQPLRVGHDTDEDCYDAFMLGLKVVDKYGERITTMRRRNGPGWYEQPQ